MSIVFLDGFEYNAAVGEKYNVASNVSFVASPVRTGSRSMRLNTNTGSGLLQKRMATAQTSMSIAFGIYFSGFSGTNYVLQLQDSSANAQVNLRFDNAGGIKLYSGSGTTTLLATSSITIATGAWYHIELDVTIDDVVGAADLYVNGASGFAITAADTKATSLTNVQYFRFDMPNGTTVAPYIDDLIVSDTHAQIGAAIVQTLYPTGAGATTGWTPSAGANYAAVDDTTGDGDSTYISTDTANAIDTYVFGNLAGSSGSVLAVAVNAVGRYEAGGAPQVAPVLRPGSTDYVGTSTVRLGTYLNMQSVWSTNPDGGGWTESAVNSSEAGIKKTS